MAGDACRADLGGRGCAQGAQQLPHPDFEHGLAEGHPCEEGPSPLAPNRSFTTAAKDSVNWKDITVGLLEPQFGVLMALLWWFALRLAGTRDRRHALWASFVIETPAGRIYAVGDSGLGTIKLGGLGDTKPLLTQQPEAESAVVLQPSGPPWRARVLAVGSSSSRGSSRSWRPTTSPAARITSIWAGVLISTPRSRRRCLRSRYQRRRIRLTLRSVRR